MLNQFKAARRVSAPIVVIQTADQWAAIQSILGEFTRAPVDDREPEPPMLMWNIASGVEALNEVGAEAFRALNMEPITLANPVEALGAALQLPEGAIMFCLNFHRTIGNEVVSQAVWNVREQFKRNGRTLVLLCPAITLPAELAQDALVLDEPLPSEEALTEIVVNACDSAELSKPKPAVLAKAVDAVSGLAAFPAEQVVAMSLTKKGIDLDGLWERKRQAIEQTPGLSVYRGGETFDDIGGIGNVKDFGRAILNGNAPPRVIVFIDEIEKALAGAGGDLSGVSQEMLGTQLSWMQDKQVTGMLLVGPPGAAKSAFAKALGNTGGIPTVVFDMSGMKGSLVGESGRNLRQAHKVVEAVARGRILVVATCNSLGTLPPELRRRFNFGIFFFDLPTAEERESIWKIWREKSSISPTDKPPVDTDWTGAEIKACCDTAWRLNISLQQAASYIVPVAVSAKEAIQRLREQADGRFVSASAPGVYRQSTTFSVAAPKGARKVALDN